MGGRGKRCFKLGIGRVMRSLNQSYKKRRNTTRKFRAFWMLRINPACREYGINYSNFVQGLRRSNVHLDRKSLCILAETEPWSFKAVVDESKRMMYDPPKR